MTEQAAFVVLAWLCGVLGLAALVGWLWAVALWVERARLLGKVIEAMESAEAWRETCEAEQESNRRTNQDRLSLRSLNAELKRVNGNLRSSDADSVKEDELIASVWSNSVSAK